MSNTTDRIITAKDYGRGSVRGYWKKSQVDLRNRRGIAVNIMDADKKPSGAPVLARIWQSQWIADCECRGASFVDPEDPAFFCFSCGNFKNGGKPRPVIFPPEDERKEIEKLLLERPQKVVAGLTDLERIAMAKPILFAEIMEEVDLVTSAEAQGIQTSRKAVMPIYKPLTRSWRPGESIEDLIQQQSEAIRKYKMVAKSKG